MKKLVTNIDWDLDSGEEELREYLPDEVVIRFEIDDEDIADALSNAFDFCVRGFTVSLLEDGDENED